MRARAVGLLLRPGLLRPGVLRQGREVLLMLRRKEGREYATLPGGGIEPGETPAQACAREMLEEVNLSVDVGEELLVLENLNNREHYFQVTFRGGEMRLGDGPEGVRHSDENWYSPAWVAIDQLEEVNLVPERARDLVRGLAQSEMAQSEMAHEKSAQDDTQSDREAQQ